MSESDQPESIQQDGIQPANAVAGWRLARESKGLSLEDVCKRTHIPVRKLEAIERGDFSELGSQTFAAGYIRNYAKVIGQDSEAYVSVYYESIGGAPDPSAAVIPNSSEKALLGPSSKKKLPILPISVAIIVIWIVVMILMPGDREAEISTVEAGEVELSPTPTKMEDMVVTATPMPVQEELPHTNEGSIHEAAPPNDESATEETPSASVVAAVSDNTTETSSNNVDTNASSIEYVQASAPAEGDDILIFSFSDECWLEVRDGEGKVLIAQLKGKGDNLRLFGQGPFQVMMGNARAVTLTINGETVSTQPLGGNKTRKMTVNSPN